jgi:ribose/xylose/arabinose/galactoside ABC-type transport system permease subunit
MSNTLTNKFLTTLMLTTLLSINSFSQSGLNKTQKQVFDTAKDYYLNDTTIQSIVMIVLVMIIVCIALWLSFRKTELKNIHISNP